MMTPIHILLLVLLSGASLCRAEIGAAVHENSMLNFSPSMLNKNLLLRGVRKLQVAGEPYACGEVIVTWNKEEVVETFDQMLLESELSEFSSVLLPLLQHGVQVRKICASCQDFQDTSVAFLDACGPSAHGSNSIVSGLLALPLDSSGGYDLQEGTLPGNIYMRPTTVSGYPTNDWGNGITSALAVIPASIGFVNILPDTLGYGESSETAFKSYTIQRAYQTSTLPLWYKAREIVNEESISNCSSALADATSVMGYSEGGYAAVAVANALDSLGVDVLQVQAGGAPFRLGTLTIPKIVESVDLGTMPRSRRGIFALFGSSYSSTNPNLENYNTGQDVLKASTRDEIVNLVRLGKSASDIEAAIPRNDPLSIFDDDLVEMVRLGVQEGESDICSINATATFGNTDFLCAALKNNDLTESLENANFPVSVCHSKDDEVVSIENVPDSSKNPLLSLLTTSGTHSAAGGFCILNYIGSLEGVFAAQDLDAPQGCDDTPVTQEPTVSPTRATPPPTQEPSMPPTHTMVPPTPTPSASQTPPTFPSTSEPTTFTPTPEPMLPTAQAVLSPSSGRLPTCTVAKLLIPAIIVLFSFY